jgi:hypothetical protein
MFGGVGAMENFDNLVDGVEKINTDAKIGKNERNRKVITF